jgi:acetolactate synthase-1/2/3 large subunit
MQTPTWTACRSSPLRERRSALLGKDSFQEVDVVGITQPIVKHHFIVRSVKELEFVLTEAFAIASSGRKGPVLVDISKSAQRDLCEYTGARKPSYAPRQRKTDITAAFEAITACKRPYIYCGGGVIAAGAEAEVLELSKRISAPIGLSMMGLTAIPHDYPLNLGMCGMHGKYAATVAQSEADLLIAVGVRFSDRATGNVAEYTKKCTVVHIDIDEAELGKNVPSIIDVCGDAKPILNALLDRLPEKRNGAWLEKRFSTLNRRMSRAKIRDAFTPRNIISCVGSHCDAGYGHYDRRRPAPNVGHAVLFRSKKPRTLLTSGGPRHHGLRPGRRHRGCVASERKGRALYGRRQLRHEPERTGDGGLAENTGFDRAFRQRRARHGAPMAGYVLRKALFGNDARAQNRLRGAGKGVRRGRTAHIDHG